MTHGEASNFAGSFRGSAPILAAGALLLVAGYVQGRWTDRWSDVPATKQFAQRLARVPMTLGDWQGEAREEPDERTQRVAGVTGTLTRDYLDSRGRRVTLFLVCGKMRDILMHGPERCYPAAGFEMLERPRQVSFSNDQRDDAGFYWTTFNKSGPTGREELRIHWCWSAGDTWTAPAEPRRQFAGSRALYKLYLLSHPRPEEESEHAAVEDFSRELLPALDKTLSTAEE